MSNRITTAADKNNLTIVIEKSWGKHHEVREGAPCAWSAERGATHTLWLGEGPGRGTRPARLLKSRLYVGVDEVNDQCVWERWEVRYYLHFGEVTTASAEGFHPWLREAEKFTWFVTLSEDGQLLHARAHDAGIGSQVGKWIYRVEASCRAEAIKAAKARRAAGDTSDTEHGLRAA